MPPSAKAENLWMVFFLAFLASANFSKAFPTLWTAARLFLSWKCRAGREPPAPVMGLSRHQRGEEHSGNPLPVLKGLQVRPSQQPVVGSKADTFPRLPTTSLSMVVRTSWDLELQKDFGHFRKIDLLRLEMSFICTPLSLNHAGKLNITLVFCIGLSPFFPPLSSGIIYE